jgi:hypothetical protein
MVKRYITQHLDNKRNMAGDTNNYYVLGFLSALVLSEVITPKEYDTLCEEYM